jgi:hypothetical protein
VPRRIEEEAMKNRASSGHEINYDTLKSHPSGRAREPKWQIEANYDDHFE